jgi:hypothetical protein
VRDANSHVAFGGQSSVSLTGEPICAVVARMATTREPDSLARRCSTLQCLSQHIAREPYALIACNRQLVKEALIINAHERGNEIKRFVLRVEAPNTL